MATNLVAKMGQNCLPPALIAVIQKRYGITPCMCKIKCATTSCKISVKIGPVVSEKILIEIALCFHVVVRRISSNISGRTGPNFAIFTPYESALHIDDGSVLYFPICQGTLPWQPNNVAEMKANILRSFFARSPDGSTVSFCYDLLLMPLYRVKFW